MSDLRERFGRLLAAHRRRKGITQEALAEAAGLSVDMVSKIETGATGARFPSIERLAVAVGVDPAELFTSNIPSGSLSQGTFGEISAKLSSLPEPELVWVSELLNVALRRREHSTAESRRPAGRTVVKPIRPAPVSRKKNR